VSAACSGALAARCASLVTAQRVLELAKNAKSLWEGRQPSERRDLLARLVCNPRLDGRTVRGRTQGFTRGQLNAGTRNAAAQALYVQLGMAPVFGTVLVELDAAAANQLPTIQAASSAHVVGRFGEPPSPIGVLPVRVRVDDNAALVNELCVAGGVVLLRMIRMAGEIPALP
jgi:hypothetical protein